MSALDDAIAAHAAHGAGACAHPLTDSLAEQCTRPAELPPLAPLRAGWEHEEPEPPVRWGWAILVALLTIAMSALLQGCGGGDADELPCRPDIMGPPAPGLAALPVCVADGRATIPPAVCTTNPERCG